MQSFDQMKSETPVERDPKTNAYVQCIVKPITQVVGSQVSFKEWEVVVFKDESANAFALPGGKIGVHTGILKVAKTPSQLAAVLGHEVGHVIAKHGNERVSETLAAQGGLSALGAFMGNKSNSGTIMGLLGMGAQFGVLLPHSRSHESEADLIGLDLMSRAGFDPRESAELWRNMMAASGGKAPPEFMSTHPASENRIKNLEAHFGQSMPKYEQAVKEGRAPKCSM